MSKEPRHEEGPHADGTTPRDAQKGGQGAVEKERPDRELDQGSNRKSGADRPSKE
jgi:hypothetical protein